MRKGFPSDLRVIAPVSEVKVYDQTGKLLRIESPQGKILMEANSDNKDIEKARTRPTD